MNTVVHGSIQLAFTNILYIYLYSYVILYHNDTYTMQSIFKF